MNCFHCFVGQKECAKFSKLNCSYLVLKNLQASRDLAVMLHFNFTAKHKNYKRVESTSYNCTCGIIAESSDCVFVLVQFKVSDL